MPLVIVKMTTKYSDSKISYVGIFYIFYRSAIVREKYRLTSGLTVALVLGPSGTDRKWTGNVSGFDI